MDEKDIVENLGTIANSGTGKFAQMLKEGGELSNLIGQFGVGFYSAFMVSSLVSVKTRKAGSKDVFLWVSNGTGEYTIEKIEDKNFKTGTQITMYLKENEEDYTDKFTIERIIKLYSNHIQYPIEFEHEDGLVKTINNTKAIWLRDKKEITAEEYKEFYQKTASMADEPFFTIHNRVEGSLEYINLLFIPSKKPFDLYSQERKASVKLYSNRVFITENNTDILPEYLRFVKGIVDSADIPLNISRETFQKNDKISKIKNSLVKKIFSELKTKQQNEREKYTQFWDNFSNVVKEGLCDYVSDKEQIMDICLFRTTKSGDRYITMDEYVERMQSDQSHIYYITGDDYKDLTNNPQLEAFKKKDIEVLLLTDAVDDFWVNVVIDHKGKDLKSITSKDVKADEEDQAKTEEEKTSENEITTMFKAVLGSKVKDVKITDKLVDSPACLSTEHGAMTIRMEKYLYEQKQLPKMSAKVLEINPSHHLIKDIFERYTASGKPKIHIHDNGEVHFHTHSGDDSNRHSHDDNLTEKSKTEGKSSNKNKGADFSNAKSGGDKSGESSTPSNKKVSLSDVNNTRVDDGRAGSNSADNSSKGSGHYNTDSNYNSTKFTSHDIDLINIIYDLACLTGGDFVSAPNDFAKRVMSVLG